MTACTLLTERLSAASADIASGLCGLSALSLVCQVVLDNFVNSEFVGLYAEDRIGELQASGLSAGHIQYFYCCHFASSLLSFDCSADLQKSALVSRNSALDEHQVSVRDGFN